MPVINKTLIVYGKQIDTAVFIFKNCHQIVCCVPFVHFREYIIRDDIPHVLICCAAFCTLDEAAENIEVVRLVDSARVQCSRRGKVSPRIKHCVRCVELRDFDGDPFPREAL